jgi:hypothetical protein
VENRRGLGIVPPAEKSLRQGMIAGRQTRIADNNPRKALL